jgi:FkbM family methyltransferase
MKASAIKRIDNLMLNYYEKTRIQMTASCHDCDSIPKVAGAGKIFNGDFGPYQLMHNSIKVAEDGYCGHWMTELIKILKGHHEPQEERVFYEILKQIPDSGTMIELGSWWSYYSIWFQKQVANATSYLIEPDPRNLELGKLNFSMNGMMGKFHQTAIGKRSQSPRPYRCYESDNVERMIPMISVDDFINREKIDFTDLLLCDIQGAELEMLEGAIKAIQEKKIRFLVISSHHHSISNDPLIHQKCLSFLQDSGAIILVEHTISESYSGDGLILASTRNEDALLPKINVSRNLPRTSLFRELEYDLAEQQAELEKMKAENKQLRLELDKAQIE